MTFITHSPEETIRFGKYIGSRISRGDVIALQGTLAAGKTTITKGIAEGLQVNENVTSPTFTLISEYHGRLPLYHMDVYRLDSTDDFLNLGVDEMLYGDGVCVVEWSEKVMAELPPKSIIIKLSALESETRQIEIKNWPYGEIPDEYTRS